VPILDSLFGPHLDNLQNALSRTTQRQALLTNNLANVNTPGYKREDMDFDITLKEEMDKPDLNPLLPSANADQGSERLDGNSVNLEKEVASITETELRYETLTQMTSDYFSQLKNVIREGK